MKKKTAALCLLAMGISSGVFAEDGTVNFTGDIIEAGCTVNSALATPISVKLGDVDKAAFSAAGSTAAETKFTLVLSNCPDELNDKNVSVKYDGTPDQNSDDYLQITGSGSAGVADGVAVQLLNNDGSTLPLGTASKPVGISDGGASMDFFARYISTKDTVTAGTANATVDFSLTYN